MVQLILFKLDSLLQPCVLSAKPKQSTEKHLTGASLYFKVSPTVSGS